MQIHREREKKKKLLYCNSSLMIRSGNSFTYNIVIHRLWSGQAIHSPAMVRSEPDHSWQPGTQNRFLTWVTWTQRLGRSLLPLQSMSPRNWSEEESQDSNSGTVVWDRGIPNSDLSSMPVFFLFQSIYLAYSRYVYLRIMSNSLTLFWISPGHRS